jgi:hypothetical protein
MKATKKTTKKAKRAISNERQRRLSPDEIKTFQEVMTWIYEDDPDKPHRLWPASWKAQWPCREGFSVGLSNVAKSKTKRKTPLKKLTKRYGLFLIRDKISGKTLTYKAHRLAMEHYNRSLHPQHALDPSDPLHKSFIGAEHIGLQDLIEASRPVRHGRDCPYNCVATTLDHLCFGSHAHNMADAGEKRNAKKPLKVPADLHIIVVALLRQGDGMEAISKRLKLKGWEVRRIADNAKLPAHLSRSEPIDRGWLQQ